MIALLGIKTAGPDVPVGSLSGGNQQKVVIAKWLMNAPRIILLNDPTRGIDVGTKQELYQLLRNLADQGAAILFYSTDYTSKSVAATRCWSCTTAQSRPNCTAQTSPNTH